MVTKEEFGEFIAEFESFRDLMLEEISTLKNDIEEAKETIDEIKKEAKLEITNRIE